MPTFLANKQSLHLLFENDDIAIYFTNIWVIIKDLCFYRLFLKPYYASKTHIVGVELCTAI